MAVVGGHDAAWVFNTNDLSDVHYDPRRACAGMDPSVFFSPRGDSGHAAEAVAICKGCMVRPECFEWMLTQPLNLLRGVVAGTTENQRKSMRGRGAARKVA